MLQWDSSGMDSLLQLRLPATVALPGRRPGSSHARHRGQRQGLPRGRLLLRWYHSTRCPWARTRLERWSPQGSPPRSMQLLGRAALLPRLRRRSQRVPLSPNEPSPHNPRREHRTLQSPQCGGRVQWSLCTLFGIHFEQANARPGPQPRQGPRPSRAGRRPRASLVRRTSLQSWLRRRGSVLSRSLQVRMQAPRIAKTAFCGCSTTGSSGYVR